MSTLASLQGPPIFWGVEGAKLGYGVDDIKGYDNFGRLLAACREHGVDLDSGEYTLLAPTDLAIEAHLKYKEVTISAELLRYHLIPGRKLQAALTVDQTTVNGGTLKYERRFRKTWLGDAVIGQAPSDVACSNGIIHAISVVLVPEGAAAEGKGQGGNGAGASAAAAGKGQGGDGAGASASAAVASLAEEAARAAKAALNKQTNNLISAIFFSL
jgi:hypothetical protein